MKNKDPAMLPRLLAMATVAGAFTASGAPAQAAPVAFAASLDAKLAPIAASLAGATPGATRADPRFAQQSGFIRFYSRISPFNQTVIDLPTAPSTERPSAVDTFRELSSLT